MKTERREMDWWSWPGLNRRPRECHSRALPTALQPHTEKDAITRWRSGQEIRLERSGCSSLTNKGVRHTSHVRTLADSLAEFFFVRLCICVVDSVWRIYGRLDCSGFPMGRRRKRKDSRPPGEGC